MFPLSGHTSATADKPHVSQTPRVLTIVGVALGTITGASLELRGHDATTCLVAVIAVQLALGLTWLIASHGTSPQRPGRAL